MSLNYNGNAIAHGSTDVRLPVFMAEDSAGTSPGNGLTGLSYTAVTAWYRREGAIAVTISLTAGASLTATHSDGAWTEEGNGAYELCLPDNAFATGAAWCKVQIIASGCLTSDATLPLQTTPIDVNLVTISGVTATPDTATQTTVASIYTNTNTTLPAQISALNNLSQAEAQVASTSAFIAYDPPTNTELNTAIATVTAAIATAQTEINKIPRTGTSHTHTNDTTGVTASVTIS